MVSKGEWPVWEPCFLTCGSVVDQPPPGKGHVDYQCANKFVLQISLYRKDCSGSVTRVDKCWIRRVKERNVEVLFCYEAYDVVVLMQLREFTNRKIVSVEKEKRQHKEAVDYEGTESSLRRSQATELMDWLKTVLAGRCWGVKATSRLESHPCVITVEEMGAARHFVHTQFTQYPKTPDTHFCSHSWKLIQGV
ncbi:heat shock protein 75 kDa, mitochondrial-like isoform X2 [Procambarus clarkii]|uniref:heat shock protein 75 kDa, mitochondrial-like isoform X2 n=1 Tax=Procambarus clarkii TaxID=6728 RepID=UPI0037429EEB